MLRSTPLKRGKSLRRKTWMRARSKTNSYRRRERDLDFMRWVRRQPCAARSLSPCDGHVQADHAGLRGLGQKADDDTCIALCQHHHRLRADFAGPFRTWDQTQMREWLREQVERHQREHQDSKHR